MAWRLRRVSSHGSDFNDDFVVSLTEQAQATRQVPCNYRMQPFRSGEAPGITLFCKDEAGTVFHPHYRCGCGVEVMMGTYKLLNLFPERRDEHNAIHAMDRVRHPDRCDAAVTARSVTYRYRTRCCRYSPLP